MSDYGPYLDALAKKDAEIERLEARVKELEAALETNIKEGSDGR